MKTENSSKEARLEFFRSLYENAKNYNSEAIESYSKNMNQYRGSYEIDGSSESALTVRNITYEIIESQVSSDIPHPKVDAACYSERKSRNARSIELLLSSLRDKLPYETINDIDERFTYIYGGSVWYVEWDNNEKLGKEVGGVKIHCISPLNFIPEPNISNVADMDYCFLKMTSTKDAIAKRYGIEYELLTLADCEYRDSMEICDSDTITVITAFYKDEAGEVGKFIFSGGVTLLDMPKFYHRKRKICKKCGFEEGYCECNRPSYYTEDEGFEKLSSQINLPDGIKIPKLSPKTNNGYLTVIDGEVDMEETKIPYYTPKSFPIVIRKNTSFADTLMGQSDCDYIRPEQQAINKIESRILQKLLRAGITPVMPEDATVSLNNSVFGQVIRMRPGESVAQYGKVDTTPDISQDITEAERLYEHSKRILGISDALQGIDSSVGESGYAKQLRISQATGRLESKRKMKHTAYALVDRLIFEQYLAFADEPRSLVFRDAYGRIHNSEFNRYDFIEYDITRGEYYYDDSYLFSVDLNGGAEYQREALWQRNLENLKAGTLGDPNDHVTLLRYWQCQERAHYPYARENVEYFSLALEEKGVSNVNEEFDKA